jgi:hypothetical protein
VGNITGNMFETVDLRQGRGVDSTLKWPLGNRGEWVGMSSVGTQSNHCITGVDHMGLWLLGGNDFPVKGLSGWSIVDGFTF